MNKWNIGDAGGIEIFLDKYSHTNEVSIDLYNQTQAEISVMSINERFPEIFNWMSLFDFNVLLIIIIMIIINLSKEKNIESALRTYKQKVQKTKQIQKLRERQEFTKKSVKKRSQINKAIYLQKKRNQFS